MDGLIPSTDGSAGPAQTAQALEIIGSRSEACLKVMDGFGIVFARPRLLPAQLCDDSFPRHLIFFVGRKCGDKRRSAIEVAFVNGELNEPDRAPDRPGRRILQDQASFLQFTLAQTAIG